MRDCNIREEILTDKGFVFQMVTPKNNETKLTLPNALVRLMKIKG